MDSLSAEERSEIMGRVRSKNSRPELAVRKIVFALGYRYRMHAKAVPGCPDLVLRPRRKIIFVHGCLAGFLFRFGRDLAARKIW